MGGPIVNRNEKSIRLSWTFPGHGDDCGITGWGRVGHPVNGRVHVHRYEHGCVNRDCPRHYRKWASRQSSAIIGRLEGQHFIQRVIVSFPKNYMIMNSEDLDKSFRLVYRLLEFAGAGAGLVMLHAERIPSRYNDREDIEDGVHFHCLVNRMMDPERVLDIVEQTGIVIKGMGRPNDLDGHLRYVLSHLGVPREIIPGVRQCTIESLNPALDGIMFTRLHTIRWFGSWCRLKKPDTEGRFCPFCGKCISLNDWGRVIWTKLLEDPPEDEWINGSELDWTISHDHCGWE
jgi:hypothetical protein